MFLTFQLSLTRQDKNLNNTPTTDRLVAKYKKAVMGQIFKNIQHAYNHTFCDYLPNVLFFTLNSVNVIHTN